MICVKTITPLVMTDEGSFFICYKQYFNLTINKNTLIYSQHLN